MNQLELLYSGIDFLNAYLTFIKSAKEEICISTFRFENPYNKKSRSLDALYFALRSALNRGVHVDILLNLYSEVKRLGQVNKKSAIILKGYGAQVRRPPGNIPNHAKVMIVDHRVLVLGSHNITRHSFGNNFELSIIVKDNPLVSKVQEIFDTAFSVAMPAS